MWLEGKASGPASTTSRSLSSACPRVGEVVEVDPVGHCYRCTSMTICWPSLFAWAHTTNEAAGHTCPFSMEITSNLHLSAWAHTFSSFDDFCEWVTAQLQQRTLIHTYSPTYLLEKPEGVPPHNPVSKQSYKEMRCTERKRREHTQR